MVDQLIQTFEQKLNIDGENKPTGIIYDYDTMLHKVEKDNHCVIDIQIILIYV